MRLRRCQCKNKRKKTPFNLSLFAQAVAICLFEFTEWINNILFAQKITARRTGGVHTRRRLSWGVGATGTGTACNPIPNDRASNGIEITRQTSFTDVNTEKQTSRARNCNGCGTNSVADAGSGCAAAANCLHENSFVGIQLMQAP